MSCENIVISLLAHCWMLLFVLKTKAHKYILQITTCTFFAWPPGGVSHYGTHKLHAPWWSPVSLSLTSQNVIDCFLDDDESSLIMSFLSGEPFLQKDDKRRTNYDNNAQTITQMSWPNFHQQQ